MTWDEIEVGDTIYIPVVVKEKDDDTQEISVDMPGRFPPEWFHKWGWEEFMYFDDDLQGG